MWPTKIELTMGYCSTVKRNGILMCVATCVELKKFIFCEISQKQKDKTYEKDL